MGAIALAILAMQSGGEIRKEKWKEGTIVRVRVPVSTEARHLITSISFPEESIQGVVQGWSEADISLDQKKATLFIKLLKLAEGHLHVIGSSGSRYTLYVTPAEAGKAYDAEVALTREEAADPRPKMRSGGKPIGSIDLIRSMRLGSVPKDGTVKKGDGRVVFQNERLKATLAFRYETPSYAGYVLDLENTTKGAVVLDLSRFSAPKLVLLGAREMTVDPGARTRLYLVFWRD